MRTVFFGTPEFALPALKRISTSPWKPSFCVTKPDAPQGRGLKLKPTPVKEESSRLGIPVLTPQSLSSGEFIQELKAVDPDLFIVVAFPIIPMEVLALPKIGSLNIHPSLLPKFRGPAPVERAIMAGEKITGVSIFMLTEKVDQGPVLAQREVVIDPEETGGELKKRLAMTGAELLLELLPRLEKGEIFPMKQKADEASWAPKIRESDCLINWTDHAEKIRDLIRALNSSPGAHTFRQMKGKSVRIKIWKAALSNKILSPGQVLVEGEEIFVGCGEGSLKVEVLQLEGKKALLAPTFLLGNRVTSGEIWG
jgi:methionyl-tRNA formyltransferase